ncbi:YtxH domain-containing protein [Marinilabiliaceae bacterium ANBcel2]|nr:YtxH domain-containing protein [Marinilabiliaceae bacterium ANBcel2]
MKSAGSFIGGLLAGAALGATIALLYTPQTGDDTRKQLKKKINELEDELDLLSGKLKTKGGELREDVKKRMTEIENRIEELVAEYKKEPAKPKAK